MTTRRGLAAIRCIDRGPAAPPVRSLPAIERLAIDAPPRERLVRTMEAEP